MDSTTTSVQTSLNNSLKSFTYLVQDYSVMAAHAIRSIFDKRNFKDLIQQMDVVGVGSLRIVLTALVCVGGVIVLNAASQFRRFGETVLTGDAVSLALLRELGPLFTALLVAGRNATGMASELGSMVVTEQVDAMRGFGVDPIRKLMTPRVLATILVLPCWWLWEIARDWWVDLWWQASRYTWTLNNSGRMRLMRWRVGDLVIGFTKPLVFGFIVATVGCYQGFRVKGGTEGVGRATIAAFVESSVIVLVADLFITRLLLYLFNMS